MSERPDLTPSLVGALRRGDAEAGALLDRLYRPAVVRLACGYLGSLEDAEDAAQEVFARVLQTDTVPADFRVWLYRVARNHCLNVLRGRGRRRDDARLPSGAEPARSEVGDLTRLVDAERAEAVAAALDALPEEQAEALRLRYVEGLSRAEMAEVVGAAEGTVKTRLFEGLRRLREGARRLDSRGIG